nr:hypothetical protein [Tanacetum cinerariifolium]
MCPVPFPHHITQSLPSWQSTLTHTKSTVEIKYDDVNEEIKEKKEPSQESDIHQLIEERSTKASEKQKMEDMMLELVKICQEKEFLCIHDDIDDLIESALNSKILLINSNSQHLDKKEQEVKNVIEQPVERGNRSIQSLQNFRVVHKRYEYLSITPETESDEVTESNAENLLPIPSECEVTLEDEIECDMPANDDCSPIFTTFSNPLFKNDDLDFRDDESLPDEDVPVEEFKIYLNPLFNEDEINSEEILLIENLLYDNSSPRQPEELNAEIVDTIVESIPSLPIAVRDGDSQREEIDIVTETDDVLPPSVENDDDSLNDSLLEEADLFLSDNSIPLGIENFADNPEGDIHFLEELLIDDFILSHKSPNSNFEDNLSIPRPPPEPPDTETDAGEEIPVVMNDKDEDVYYSFIFVIFAKMFSLLSVESEDTIFDPQGDICFLEELLINDFILSHESSVSNLADNPSILRPPPEPPDAETDAGEEIPVVMNEKDKDYSSFIFVIFDKMFSSLSAESEDTIFDPGFTPSD